MSFASLLPDVIFDAVEEQGYQPTGVLYPLNSYENRVYEIHLEEADPLVAKFYRPGRWDEKALVDEHQFMQALKEVEVPVVTPFDLVKPCGDCVSLGQNAGFFYALYPKFRGRERDEMSMEDREWLGRLIARMHNVGEHFQASHRLQLNPQTYGEASLKYILNQPFIDDDLKKNLETLLQSVLTSIHPFFNPDLKTITLHGDCHPGNLLWNPDGPHFVDFDDMVIAPPVQDIWMLFYGSEDEKAAQKEAFFKGYEMFRTFDATSLRLAEPLRTLRMIRHTAWIGERCEEEAFKRAFPYYKERRYWEEFLLSMKEQTALIAES